MIEKIIEWLNQNEGFTAIILFIITTIITIIISNKSNKKNSRIALLDERLNISNKILRFINLCINGELLLTDILIFQNDINKLDSYFSQEVSEIINNIVQDAYIIETAKQQKISYDEKDYENQNKENKKINESRIRIEKYKSDFINKSEIEIKV